MTTITIDRATVEQALKFFEEELGWSPDEALLIDALRAALAQKHDPVAHSGWVLREVLFDNGEPIGYREPQHSPAAPPQQAEPVEPVAWEGWWLHHGQHNYRAKPLTSERVKELMKLAFEVGREAAPPQRKPLTDEEIDAVWDQWFGAYGLRGPGGPYTRRGFARAVEQAHGIKENAND